MAKLASTRVYGNLVVDNALNIAGQLTSAVATGTAPLVVASTTKVTNLNADLLDDMNATSANTVSTIVARDEWGNFEANRVRGYLGHSDGPRNLTDRNPNWASRTVAFDFVNAGVVGGSGAYGGVMTFTPLDGTTASTGDSSYQLAFANLTGVNASGIPALKIRNGIDSTWNAWHTFYHTGNKPTATDVGAATSAQGATADTAIQSGSFAGTAFTKTGTALSITQTAARTALGLAGGAYVEAYTHPTPTRTDTASTAAPAFGGTFTAVDSVTSNTDGHVTAINLKTVTIPTPSTVNDGTLSWTTSTAGATNTTVAGSLSGAYSANTANNRTLSLAIGPAITSLATVMTGAATGLLKKTGADTYGLDANLYAGSASAGGAASSVASSITFNTTGGAAAGTTFNGSAARTIDYSTIGAAASSHTHGNISNAGVVSGSSQLDTGWSIPVLDATDVLTKSSLGFDPAKSSYVLCQDGAFRVPVTSVTQAFASKDTHIATTEFVNRLLQTNMNTSTITATSTSGTVTQTICSLSLISARYYRISFIGRCYASNTTAAQSVYLAGSAGIGYTFGSMSSALASASDTASNPFYLAGGGNITSASITGAASTSTNPYIIHIDAVVYTNSDSTINVNLVAAYTGTTLNCYALAGCSLTATLIG